MRKYLISLTLALTAFTITSIIWFFALIQEKNFSLYQLESNRIKDVQISMLEHKIALLESRTDSLNIENNRLSTIEFKYNLLTEIEKKRHIRVSTRVIDAVHRVSEETKYGVPFLLAWADTEASLHPNPKPWRNVKGILQVNYYTWRKELNLDRSMMGDPYYNMHKGIDVLEIYLDMANGDMQKALFFYNNGPSGKYKNNRYAPKIKKKQMFYAQIINGLS